MKMKIKSKFFFVAAAICGAFIAYFSAVKTPSEPQNAPPNSLNSDKKTPSSSAQTEPRTPQPRIEEDKASAERYDPMQRQPTSQTDTNSINKQKKAELNLARSERPSFVDIPVFQHQLVETSEDLLFDTSSGDSAPQRVEWHQSCSGEKHFFSEMNGYLRFLGVDTSLYPSGGIILDWNLYFSKGAERIQLSANWQGNKKEPRYIVGADISRTGSLSNNLQPLKLEGLTMGAVVPWPEAAASLVSIKQYLEADGFVAGQRTAVLDVPLPTDPLKDTGLSSEEKKSLQVQEPQQATTVGLQIQLIGTAVKTLQRGAVFCNKRDSTLCFCKTN